MITNHHVVEGFGRVTVVVNDSASYQGTVRGIDHVRDLSVVSICCGRFQALPFGEASDLEAGDEVVAIGYALGLSGEATITRGIVSATRFDAAHQSEVIQTDAAINPGNSGGPMLSPAGEILGINTFRYDESDSGRPAEGLGFAISEETVRARIPALKAGRAASTPTPAWIQPLPSPTGTFGPISADLRHDPSDGLITVKSANDFMDNMIVEATFVNPYSAASNSWDYGFIFREEVRGPRLHIVVTSNKRWDLQWRETPSADTSHRISNGLLHNFDTSSGGRNHLRIIAIGERGWLFVNGGFVSLLDISAVTNYGDVLIMTGAFTGNQVDGAVTRFENFKGDLLTKGYGPANGRLVTNEPGFISKHDSSLWTRDLVAEAEFISPRSGQWGYGFAIRNSETNRLDVIYMHKFSLSTETDPGWAHCSRDIGDTDYTHLAGSVFPKYERLPLSADRNHLSIIVMGDTGWFFANGQMVKKLDFTNNLDIGRVGTISHFYADEYQSIEFRNFNVWTP